MAKIDIKKIKASYGTDLEAEVEGKWFPLALIEGVKVCVARAGNPAYQKMFRKLYKPYSKQAIRGKSISPAIEERIQIDLIVNILLKDWSGMPGENGRDIPYSKELARELISDLELKELKDEIVSFSEEFEAYQKDIVEELAKN